jgi:hypothetical protein
MPDRQEDGSDTLTRFAVLGRIAKMRTRLANIGSDVDVAKAGASVEKLVAFADECSALESHKHRPGRATPFARLLQKSYGEISNVLDRHVPPGSAGVTRRRVLLATAAEFATGDINDEFDDKDIAETLNAAAHRATEDAFRQSPNRTFTSNEARRLVEAVETRNRSIEQTVRNMDTLFRDVNLDDVRGVRKLNPEQERRETNEAIRSLEVKVLSGIGQAQQDLLLRIERNQAERRDRALAVFDDDFWSTVSPTPQGTNGKRKRDLSEEGESEQPGSGVYKRRRLLGKARCQGNRSDFAIHEDGEEVQATIENFHNRLRQANPVGDLLGQGQNAVDVPARPAPSRQRARDARALLELRPRDVNTRTR